MRLIGIIILFGNKKFISKDMRSKKSLLKIGLTGGLASGKSTVANFFMELGVAVIDTDQIAKELVQKDMPAFQQIVKHFGSQILQPDGSLNRRLLRSLIFKSPQQRLWLENLLHPLIRQNIIDRLPTISSAYCILVIPLLAENHPHPLVDRILVVDIPESLQIARAQLRDQMTHEQTLAMLKTQAGRQQRLALANDIIYNTGSLDELKAQVIQLHQHYLRLTNSAKSNDHNA